MGSGSIDIWLLTEPWRSFNSHQIPQRPKPSIADSAHNDQMFGAAKGAEPLTVIDNALSQALSDSGQRFQFVCRGGVDID